MTKETKVEQTPQDWLDVEPFFDAIQSLPNTPTGGSEVSPLEAIGIILLAGTCAVALYIIFISVRERLK